jgi:hypothetical protein
MIKASEIAYPPTIKKQTLCFSKRLDSSLNSGLVKMPAKG